MKSILNEYYNFEVSENEISFEPYWYEKSKFVFFIISGIIVLIVSSIFYRLTPFKESLLIGSFLSVTFFLIGAYRWFVKKKTVLVFNKSENSLYRISPLRKKKLLELQNAQTIVAISAQWNFYYILINKKKNTSTRIQISPLISYKRKNNPEVRFLEMEIIPKIESFLQLQNASDLFASEINSNN